MRGERKEWKKKTGGKSFQKIRDRQKWNSNAGSTHQESRYDKGPVRKFSYSTCSSTGFISMRRKTSGNDFETNMIRDVKTGFKSQLLAGIEMRRTWH